MTGGVLGDPSGMVVAPHTWGKFANALLVGTENGGQINAFDPHSGRFLGTVRDATGQQIGEDGLWGMAFGNSVFGTPQRSGHRDRSRPVPARPGGTRSPDAEQLTSARAGLP